jgi:putative addiction module CopG family antidote
MLFEPTPEMNEFIRRQIESGRFETPADVIAEAMRLLDERDLADERRAADDSERGGPSSER